eukprot:COSAG01_NODE_10772_length_2083_cov_2.639113_1_plen_471_part_00
MCIEINAYYYYYCVAYYYYYILCCAVAAPALLCHAAPAPWRCWLRGGGGGPLAMSLWPLLLICLSPAHTAAAAPLLLVVDPNSGDDANVGTSTAAPLRTLYAAQLRLRSALALDTSRSVSVELLHGTHRVPPGGLQITAADSPADGHAVHWRGAASGRSIISGGVPVTGWAKCTDPSLPAGVFAAPAPPLPASNGGAARHLFVDGVRAVRTRVNITAPNGRQTAAGARDLPHLSLERRADCPACSYTVNSSGPLHWPNAVDIEFVYPVGMSEPRCTVARAEAGAGGGNTTRLVMKQPCLHNLVNRDWQPVGTILPVWVENVRAHLTRPGQFYHDRGRKQLLYYPLPGQDMASARAVLAVEEVLVMHSGARHQLWANLSFQHATWLRPMRSLGFVEQQAAACDQCPYGVANRTHHGVGCGRNDDYVSTCQNVARPGNVARMLPDRDMPECCPAGQRGGFWLTWRGVRGLRL